MGSTLNTQAQIIRPCLPSEGFDTAPNFRYPNVVATKKVAIRRGNLLQTGAMLHYFVSGFLLSEGVTKTVTPWSLRVTRGLGRT